MRLTFNTQSAAQARANSIHADMVATNAEYAAQAVCWAIPFQDLDEAGNPIDTLWYINVGDRCRAVLTVAEISTIPEWATPE